MVSKTVSSLILASLAVTSAFAQEIAPESASAAPGEVGEVDESGKYNWQTSGKGKLGDHATIDIPEGMRFLNGRETDLFMQEKGNLPAVYEGMISTLDYNWFVVFEYTDSGYVKDDEKDDLDADALLKALKESDKEQNKARLANGLGELHTVGWAMKPTYNTQTNNLEYGLILEDSDGNSGINYLTFLLGRHGTMNPTLLCDPNELDAILPDYQKTLLGFRFNPGNTYAEYQEGDKVAEYGLKALVAGGAVFAAAKLGLFGTIALWFKKAMKLIIVAVAAVGLWIKRLITGKKADA